MQENPFYIHLEPDPLEVLKKKKEAQQEVKHALEEQIAARLLLTQVSPLPCSIQRQTCLLYSG